MIDRIGEWLSEFYDSILNLFAQRILMIFTGFLHFFTAVAECLAPKAITYGDYTFSLFSKYGIASPKNFVYIFIGVVMIVFLFKCAVRIMLKIIDIVASFTP